MLTLYTYPLSTPALSVLLAANAMGVEHNVDVIDLASGQHMSPDYKKINPLGKVPALKDGAFTLAESGAIIKYMARKVKSPLYPSELKARAVTEQWFDFVAFHVRTPFSRVQFNRMFAERIGQKKDEASIAFGLHILSTSLPQVDSQIAKNGFLAGQKMTIADIVLLATLDPSEVLEIDLSPYKALTAWRDRLRSEAFYTTVHSHYGAEIGL